MDDSFEEHLFEYPVGSRGLYLHGLNENTAEFKSRPVSDLVNFSTKFGFPLVEHEKFNSIDDLFAFITAHQNTGSYKNRYIEGFVIRCKKEARDFLFKVKFNMPYSLFREWRTVTTGILLDPLASIKYKFPITAQYVPWIFTKLKQDPQLFSGYLKNQGIIKVRNEFLAAHGYTNVSQFAESLQKSSMITSDKTHSIEPASNPNYIKFNDWSGSVFDETLPLLIVPVAMVGCGKTSLGLCLNRLFQVAHVQNDDFRGKNKRVAFTNTILSQFKQGTMTVYADRNNHQIGLRRELIEAYKCIYPKGRVIVLDWEINKSNSRAVYDICESRIMQRLVIQVNNHR